MSLGKGFLGDSKLIIPPAMPLMNHQKGMLSPKRLADQFEVFHTTKAQ